MKANSLDELVTNSNIAGELRNYTDWHTRLVKFAQLVADWQKEQMLKEAVDAKTFFLPPGKWRVTALVGKDKIEEGDKVRIVVLKEKEE